MSCKSVEKKTEGNAGDERGNMTLRCPRCNAVLKVVSEDQSPRMAMLFTPSRRWGPEGADLSRTSYGYAYCRECDMSIGLRMQLRYSTPGRKA